MQDALKLSLPSRLNLAVRPTPLQLLPRLSEELGGPRLWAKRDDLTGSVLSGNKVRKLEFTLARAVAEGADTIITCGGLQSNHCRATALLCAQLGLHCELVLSGEATEPFDGNLLLDHLAGANVSAVSPDVYKRELPELLQSTAEAVRARGGKPYVIPTGASDAVGVWGYVAACAELRDDCARQGISPGAIICATGSGGTQAGLTAGAVLHGLSAQVWGFAVCDDSAYFQNKIRQDLRDWSQGYALSLDIESLDIRVIDDYIGPGYAKADPEVFDTIAHVARTEGLVFDPVYTGKAFHGLVEEVRRGRFDGVADIIFLHTGGVFGVFPQRDQFRF